MVAPVGGGERRRRWLLVGLSLVILALAVAILVRLVVRAGGPVAIASAAGRVDLAHWAALVPATIAFYSLDWLRCATLLAILGHRLPYRLGLELAAVSYFVTCLTPTSELHLPAMVLWLVHRGYPVGAATAASLAKSIYMLLWACVTGLVGLAAHAGPITPPGLGAPFAIAFLVPAGLVCGLALAVAFPGRVHALCARRLARPTTTGWRRILIAGVDDTVRALATIGRSRSASHLAAHGACLAFVGCYIAIGWLLADGVGLRLAPGAAASTFPASLMVAYIAPTPGGAGATESVTAFLLDPSMSVDAATVALLLRTLCTYAIAPLGLVFVIRQARRLGWQDFRARLRAAGAGAPPDDARVDP